MTQVGKMLMDSGIQEGELRNAKKVALKMLRRGEKVDYISELLELPSSMIQAWEKEEKIQ